MLAELDAELNRRLDAIELPVSRIAKRTFQTMMRQTMQRGQGEILLVTGEPGSGKTHLRRQLAQEMNILCAGTTRRFSSLSVVLETAAGLKDLSRQVARQFGNPVIMSKVIDKSAKDISFEVQGDIVNEKLPVMFLDEAHNIRFSKRTDEALTLAAWFKNLTYEGVSLVFFSLPEFAEVLSHYPELVSRLFRPTPIQTTGAGLKGDTREAIEVTLRFLADVQAAYGVDAQPAFNDSSIVVPLMGGTGGHLRAIMRIVHGAVTYSRERENGFVTIDDFISSSQDAAVVWKNA